MWKIRKIHFYDHLEGNINWKFVVQSLAAFMLLPPFIGIPMVIFQALKNQKNEYSKYVAYFFCIAAYFAAINSTKAIGGDQIQYAWAYWNVPTQGFWGSLRNIYGWGIAHGRGGMANISGEFMNGVYNFFGYYLTFGQYWLFIFCYSLIEHLLIFFGLYHYCQRMRNPRIPIVCGVLIVSFFYLFFNLSLQIQKQFMAQAIVMYVLGRYSRTQTMDIRSWIIMAIAAFTHASTLIFVPFLVYKPLTKRLTMPTMAMLVAMVGAFIIIGPSVFDDMNLENQGAIGYGLDRFTNMKKSDDGIAFSYTDYRTLIVGIPFLFCLFKSYVAQRRVRLHSDAFFMNILVLFLAAIVAMTGRPLLQYRYFMVLYFFMPFIYPSAFYNISKRNTFLEGTAIFIIFYFYLMFDNIIWHYAPESHIVFFPPSLMMGLDHYAEFH